MNKLNIKNVLLVIFTFIICCITTLSACIDFSSNILTIRSKVEKLRHEMSETIIEGFKEKNVSSVKELFCPKSRELPDIDEEIEATFTFLEGNIESYTISDSTSYEDYASDYGKVDDYEFGSDIFIHTDTGKRYEIYLDVKYITDDSVKGMTFYSLTDRDADYTKNHIRRAGYKWFSPYDDDFGLISANLIKAIANSDTEFIKNSLCSTISEKPATDSQIQALAITFDGTPLFTEREDGLYNFSDIETDFSCCILAYRTIKDDNGNTTKIWAHVITRPICTDTGKKYELDFVTFLQNDVAPKLKGISFLSLSEYDSNNDKISVGDWIDYNN